MPIHGARIAALPDDGFARDVARGLARTPKRLPSKYFYDAEGSRLFERICEQPEYYLTRVELALMQAHVADIAAQLGPGVRLVEYGSGAGIKTRLLLAHLHSPAGYVPVEISAPALQASVAAIAADLPQLPVRPVCADFTRAHRLPDLPVISTRTVIYFPGSTLGNFEPDEAVALLRQMRAEMGSAGAALIGIDLDKDRVTLEAAYNDAAGVTAAFTLNLLSRINRELDGDFDIARFAHRAQYNAMASRIETAIISRCAQDVCVAGTHYRFADDEAMAVEISSKYRLDRFDRLAGRAGLGVRRYWTDPERAFAVVLLEPVSADQIRV
ncbi:MAG: L-histidine N(alpha)-methyltransferase [Gammaproteobacteria bacterium HGW-Gammaproteobacteria-4]|jgi:dimethylhistidine N-methyltransferase|nr:MAG: L-histidine N(alpha)-methyltransferase [Gammaproteobacteria bacterium HGW-Gammaproteobacteria-4]